MAGAANLNNISHREFWTSYVRTVQYEAGKELGLNANDEVVNRDKQAGHIAEAQRPNIANYNPIVFNWNPWIWNWGSNNRVVVQQRAQSREEQQAERDEARAAQARVIGSVVAFVGTLLAAYTVKKFTRQYATNSHSYQVSQRIAGWNDHDPLIRDIKELVTHQRAIDELNAWRIGKYALAAFALFAGGTTLAIGGFAAIPALMTAGTITILVSALIAAGTFAWHWDDAAELGPHYDAIAHNPREGGFPLAERILRDLPGRMPNSIFHTNEPQPNAPDAPQPAYEHLYPVLNQAGLQGWVRRPGAPNGQPV